ncbi:coil containing protein [Vibrio phage 1.232.O._10N.261.51.E11]|nr:coil containing protein [Vibrio phage 1.232.O._10N.261.51.E11]
MKVSAKTDVDKALETKNRVEAIQEEQQEIASSEQLDGNNQDQQKEPPRHVVEENDNEIKVVEKPIDPRTQYANELQEQQRQRRDEELRVEREANGFRPQGEAGTDDDDNLDGEDFEESQDEIADEFENSSDSDVNLDQPGFHGDTVTLKVDGQLVKMPADKALSLLQKSQSADQRLEQASLREQRLNQREQALQQREQFQPPSQGVAKVDKAEVQREVQAAFELLEDGDTSKAVEHLTKVLTNQNPTATAEQVANQVRQQLNREQADSVESRLKASGKYDDIFSNPTAYKMAIGNLQSMQSSGFNGSIEDKIVEAMEQVRDFRTGKSREERLSQRQDDKPSNNRRAKKRNAPRSASSASQAPRKAVVKEREPTATEKRNSVFEQLKAARNQ